jgi:hypothetical protein
MLERKRRRKELRTMTRQKRKRRSHQLKEQMLLILCHLKKVRLMSE